MVWTLDMNDQVELQDVPTAVGQGSEVVQVEVQGGRVELVSAPNTT